MPRDKADKTEGLQGLQGLLYRAYYSSYMELLQGGAESESKESKESTGSRQFTSSHYLDLLGASHSFNLFCSSSISNCSLKHLNSF